MPDPMKVGGYLLGIERLVEELLKFENAEEGGRMFEVFTLLRLFTETVPLGAYEDV